MEIIYDLIFYLTRVFSYSFQDVEDMTPFEAEILYYKCLEFEEKKRQAEQQSLAVSK